MVGRSSLGVFLLVCIVGCDDGSSLTRRSVVTGIDVPSLTVTGADYVVDPVSVGSSPLSATITKITLSGYLYRFTATASGASSGQYEYLWLAEDCNPDNTCSQPASISTGSSNTVDFQSYGSPAYSRVQVLVREAGNDSYNTTISNALVVKGVSWPDGTSGDFSCVYGNYPFREHITGSTTRNYRRNLCTGAKELQP